MFIYGYKGKKSLTSENFWNNDATRIALFSYINLPNFSLSYDDGNMWARHVYRIYTTLCKFNSSLVNTYEVTDNYIDSISFVQNYLEQNTDIENGVDSKCRSIYDHLRIWYKRLVNNPNSLDDIK